MGDKKAATARRPRAKQADTDKAGATLLALMKARAPASDLDAYDAQTLDRAARIAEEALRVHHRGTSVVRVDTDPDIVRNGRAQTVITVVNDNMPFLFDSVRGEIDETAEEASLVLHPVLHVRHDATGVADILGDAGPGRGDGAIDRVSLIHVHVPRLGEEAGKALAARLKHTLAQVRAAVAHWKPMLARIERAITEYRYGKTPIEPKEIEEAVAFLEWLRDDNFTFLGMREFDYVGDAADGRLERAQGEGLGILADPDVRVLRRGEEPVTTTPEIRAFLHGPEPLIVTKANAKSSVHRRIYLDYIGVKTFDSQGKLTGEVRIVGLFTSTAYTRSVMHIPYLRSKAKAVIARSGFDPHDHSGKALINVLESYPRDELFQISVPILRRHVEAILALGERPRVRVLYRVDQFDRFVSVIVFVPRDRYDSRVRVRIGDFLKETFQGRVSAYYPAFPEGTLARVHFIIGRSEGKTPKVDSAALEEGVRRIVRTWDDALREAVTEKGAAPSLASIAARFPESYRNSFAAGVALADAERVRSIGPERSIAIDFYGLEGERAGRAGLKIYHRNEPVALSRRVPLLENMGFRVISERTFEIEAGAADGVSTDRVFLHDMEIESADGAAVDLGDGGKLFEAVFLSVWNDSADNDAYNGLARSARLDVERILILRAYGRYLQQAGIPQSQDFVAGVLNRYPAIAADLYDLFAARFDPRTRGDEAAITAGIEEALENVPSLDDDTIIRRYVELIGATLRTNHFAEISGRAVSLALKLSPQQISGLPVPKPWREIFVYGPEVEGVHLRFGPVARGGLRWSDRAQDYRTEVLGLVKAQQVKNAVIVPVGAKGGFYPKRLPRGDRDAIFEAGKRAYINFIASLLSITDNIDGDRVVPPHGVIRHDGDDPYFVVAADKGTATFSDTANAISQAHDFWLDDAFASGGSAGYDHKKMGITARGAWEAVKRHFREMNRDIQNEPFTVVGVGDMSGDVFGNGMLLSPHIRLIAAFDHRDIFIDPEPDAASSLTERRRLFEKGRSSWQDYDRAHLSKGGMIVPRTQKSVKLTPEAAAAIGMAEGQATPNEIMRAILKARVDLLWFGGIGTYVRSMDESPLDVGDRANDAIRITAREVGAKVVGEGANLGMTQRARIEYDRAGGRCNSDAIDNSAGVNSSDVEVNIKIALAAAMRGGALKRPARDKLLARMTDEVARLVLSNNYEQTLAISLVEGRGLSELSHEARLMSSLEARGLLDRDVEYLPGPETMAERQERGEALTRPEVAVLLAYAKIVLFDDLVESGVPDDPHFENDLLAYFPRQMQDAYGDEILGHRLRREIIASELGNDLVNRGGPTFISRINDLTGRAAHEAAAAYAIVRGGYELRALYTEFDALDGKVDGTIQLELYQRVWSMVMDLTTWILKNEPRLPAIGEGVAAIAKARATIEPALDEMLPPSMQERLVTSRAALIDGGVPAALARRLALLEPARLVPDIALASVQAGTDQLRAARAFFAASDAFRIGRIENAARALQPTDHYDGLALSRALDMIGAARRAIAVAALKAAPESDDAVDDWLDNSGQRVARTRERLLALSESGEVSVSRLTVAAGLLGDLAQ